MNGTGTLLRAGLLAAFAMVMSGAYAQLTVSPQTDLQALARAITGPGVTIANPEINCAGQGYGEFHYSGTLLGIDDGILLTSGKIANAVGPNNAENTTSQQSTGGSSILNAVTGRTTYDACKFEFDVIPAGDTLRFDFVFGSEEYNEWVGSQYNDVFGFFISGPGIAGDPGIGNDRNIALVPGTDQAVTINNVNNGSNAAFFHDNAGGQFIQYDGITRGLSAVSQVQPCQTYHLKLIVADASDKKYDSGVFIAKVKSNPITMEYISQSGTDSLIEGCNDGAVRFTRETVTDQPLTLQYYLHGTATNGTDYTAIGSTSPAIAKTITIPANQAFAEQPITTIPDALAEGPETLLFILGNPNCPASITDTLVVTLVDSLNAAILPPASMICANGQVQLLATGGSDYTWSPVSGLSAANIPDPIAQPATTRTYTVHIVDGACSRTLSTTVKVSAMALTGTITRPLCNGDANGAINLAVSGGIAPYAFQWSGPNGFTATTEDIAGIPAGTYTVTVTDAACAKTQSFNVTEPAPLGVSLAPSLLIFGQNISCSGGHDGSIDGTITGGTGPYSTNWTGPGGFTSANLDISGLGAGTYSVSITDAGGCTATASTTLLESAPMVAVITATTDVACAGDANGTATVELNGGMPNYTYNWNTVPVQNGATATGLSPGTYTVTAHDQYGCSTSTAATITGPVQPLHAHLAAKADVACFGHETGSATAAITGGTPPYNLAWNTVPVQNTLTASGLTGGSYTASVADANGCSTSLSVSIEAPALPLSTSVTAQQNVRCHGQGTGSATVNASGGSGPYSYTWNTTPARSGAGVTGLTAGNYAVTVTDAHGCTAVQNVVITEPATALVATITGSSNVSCAGGTNGSATMEVVGGATPYTFAWNTTPPQSGTTATGLGSGNWQVTVQDANQCTATASVILSQPAPLVVNGMVSPAQCQGSANGAIDVTTSFGTPPYTWAWTGPSGFTAATEDISALAAGGYTLIVTDANGCSATRSFDVNQPGLFTASATSTMHGNANVSCPGATDGAIGLAVSGALPPYSFAWSGPGGFSASSQDVSDLAAGEYAVAITDHNGCSTSLNVTLLAPEPIEVQLALSNFGGTAIACSGGSNGSITTVITGGNPAYTTAWTGPSGFSSPQADLNGLAAGSYQLTVTDQNGCSTTQAAVVNEPAPLSASNGGTNPATCFGSATGQATVHVSGGRAPYAYTWNTVPPQHAATATGLAAGNYTVSVTDGNGCSTSTSIAVAGPAASLAITIPSVTDVLCNMGQTGAATAQAIGGTAPYTYTWNTLPQTNGPSANGLAAGTWTVSVTDAAGCTVSRNVVISQPQLPLSATLASRHYVTCFGDDDGSISIIATGGSGNYNISWNTVPVQTGSTANNLAAGSYAATIADANGCMQSFDFPVSIGGPTAALALALAPYTYSGGAHVSCPGNSDGSIDLTVTGGTGPYNYAWQDGSGNLISVQDPSGLSAGTYHLSVGDGHGCFTDTVITLMAPTKITATAMIHSAICHGASDGAVDMAPTGGVAPYSYQWSGPNGFSATSQDLNMIAAGVYTVVITDANGCTASLPFDVTEPGTFAFNASVTQVACNGSSDGAITLAATGGTSPYEYLWSGPSGFTATTTSISGLAAGPYHMVLTDANGCAALYSTNVTAPAPITVFSISHKNHSGYDISCNGASDGALHTTYSGGTPPYSFSWTGPNGFTASTADISGLAAGTYSLTVTDANGCSMVTSSTLFDPPVLSATAVVGNFAGGSGTSCTGATDGSIILAPTGGTPPYAVMWAGPDGFTSTSWQITGLEPGTYTAEVSDHNGCSLTMARALTAPLPVSLSFTSNNITCNAGANGTVDLTVSGGNGTYTYLWNGPNTFTSTMQDLSGISAGSYSVTVTDANGCTATASILLTEPAPIQASAVITTAACQNFNTGAIDLSVTGGTGGYAFQWSGFPAFSATTEDIGSLFAGVYSVMITDASGCSLSTSFNVGEPGLFDITAELGNMAGGYNVSCAGSTDGAIDATVSGGTGPLSYFWTGPNGFTSINLDINDLEAGEYSLTVHDANGCNGSANFTLVAPAPVTIGLVATSQPSCTGGENGSIDATILGGTAPYTASWSGPDGPLGITQNLTGVGAGTYVITVSDALGCTGTGAIMLNSPDGIDAVATPLVLPNGSNLSCTTSADGSIDLAISGGTAPYLVAWAGPDGYQNNMEDIGNLAAGTYTATITDANGCTFATQVNLLAPSPLSLSITTSSYSGGHAVSCAGASDGTINLAIAGGSPAYTTSWTGPGGFTSQQNALQNLMAGTYSVTVTDASGCTSDASVTLNAPAPISTSSVLSHHNGFEVGCDGGDGFIDLSVNGGLAPYQYSWTGPNGFGSSDEDLQNLDAGTYTALITDANGCSSSRTFNLTAPAPITTTLAVASNECDQFSDGAINLTIGGGVAPFTINWSGPNGFTSTDEDLTGLASGEYAVAVTSAMGCSTTTNATVIAAAPMTLDLYASDYGQVNIPCHGDSSGTIGLSVVGGFTPLSIAWSGPAGFTSSDAYISGLIAGTYAVTITDDHGCARDTSLTLVEPATALTTVLSATDIACHGDSSGLIDATVSGGAEQYLFSWRGPDSTLYSSEDLSGLTAGDYELVVTDANQCVNTMQITITEPDSALAVQFSVTEHYGYNTSCTDTADGAIDMHLVGGTPGYTWSWSGPDGFNSTQDSLSGLAAGTYVLTAMDANGCSTTQNITLVPPPPISAVLDAATFPSGTNISCFGMNDGAITATVSGGAPAISLLWTGPAGFTATTASIDSLSAGIYCVAMTDANGCSAQQCTTLIAPDELNATASTTAAPCGLATGAVDAGISGGSAPYGTIWDNGSVTEDLNDVPAGIYVLAVMDANGCTATATAIVAGSPGVQATATVDIPLCHTSNEGALDLSVLTGLAPWTYLWNNGETSEDLSGLAAGEYSVTVTDANGCAWDSVITVAAPDAITADTVLSHFANGHNISTWNGSNGSIELSPSGGTPPYTYAWNDGASTASRFGLAARTYTVTITDANGCSLLLTITLTQPDDLEMPTGFTPNGDGNNDAFVVHGIDGYPENQLTVFNRWGNVVFDQLHYANEWRGENQQGKPLPDGTYFVILRLNAELTLQHYVDIRR